MVRQEKQKVIETIIEVGVIPIFYHEDFKTARSITEACYRGGARVVEFTNRGEKALDVFSQLNNWSVQQYPQFILGAGSILDAGTAALFIEKGAQFIVSPALKKAVAKFCNRKKIIYIPGCGSVTEISQAQEWGAEICKIFPAKEVGGPGFIKALLGPMPWSKVMPTGGVELSKENIFGWIQAGATCLGMGSHLIPSNSVTARKFQDITENVKKSIEWVREARQSKSSVY